jgi:hypothetical protein
MSFGEELRLPELIETTSAYSEHGPAPMTAYVYRPLFDILLVGAPLHAECFHDHGIRLCNFHPEQEY